MLNGNNLLCFFDDSHNNEDLIAFGGIIFDEGNKQEIKKEWRKYKNLLSPFEDLKLKWSPEDKTTKEVLMNYYKHDWLTSFRFDALNVISSMNLQIVISMHQDIRWKTFIKNNIPKCIKDLKRYFPNEITSEVREILRRPPTDFLGEAFNYVLQRIARNCVENCSSVSINLDIPPKAKFSMQQSLTRIYRKHYFQGFSFPNGDYIRSLENLGFCEVPSFLVGGKSTFCQIADFCVGVVQNWGNHLISMDNSKKELNLLKIIKDKFICNIQNGKIVGYGLVIWPPQAKIYELVKAHSEQLTISEHTEDRKIKHKLSLIGSSSNL